MTLPFGMAFALTNEYGAMAGRGASSRCCGAMSYCAFISCGA